MAVKIKVGDVFDEFEVVEHIGTGAFSEVFLAHDTILNRVVVLKQLSPDLSENDSEWDAFVNEARLTASLFHPGIITIHGLRIDPVAQSAVLVLEYMDGGTLRDLIEEYGPLDLELIWKLTYQIGDSLHYLHTRGIIHRDIKPENILYSRETGWFKLTDFGLAYDPLHPEFESLNSGQPGTLVYMSPEQTRSDNSSPVSERSDLYTFTAVIYEALTAAYYLPINPHELEPEQIADHIRQTDFAHLPQFHSNQLLIDKMESVFTKGLAKHRLRRYPTVRRFVRAFTRIIEQMQFDPVSTASDY